MRNSLALALAALLALVLASCGGSAPGDFGNGGSNLPDLDFFLSTTPESSVQSTEVEGEMLEEDDALNAREASSLPSGFIFRQGMHFTPVTGPGEGFEGRLDVRVSQGSPAPNEFEGVLLYLFYVDPVTHACTQVDSSRGRIGNRVTFDLDVLGFMVIAENSSVPRPGDQFTVSAFADQSLAQVGTVINFWAVPQNGTAPITYTWDFGDGSQGSGETTSHSYSSAGTYNIGLQAVDGQGRIAPASSTPITITTTPNPLQGVTVTPIQDNQNPRAFSFSSTVTGGNGELSYSWDFDGDGTVDSTDGPPVIFILPAFGMFEGSLTVTDAIGDTASDSFVLDARLLTLQISPADGAAPLPVTITLVAEGFDAADVIIVDMGNGDVLTAPVTGYTYPGPGDFVAQASGSTSFNGQDYPKSSAQVLVSVSGANPDTLPFIQLTQPLQPAPNTGFVIHGFRFGASQGNRSVTLGGAELTVKSWDDDSISLETPLTPLADGPLVISAPEGDSNTISLNILEPGLPNLPAIQNILPQHPAPGERILVIGNGLDQCDGSGSFNGTALTLPNIDDACFELNVPAAAATGASSLVLNLSSGEQISFGLEVVSTSGAPPSLDPIDGSILELGSPNFQLNLSGNLLGDGLGDLVFADGFVCPTSSWSSTAISVSDPLRPLLGKLVVIREEEVSNSRDIIAVFRPIIDALDPAESWEGAQVTINGQHFGEQQGASTAVLVIPTGSVGETELALIVDSWSDTQIVVTIPDTADDGQVFVRTFFESNGVDLNIIPPPPGAPGGGQF